MTRASQYKVMLRHMRGYIQERSHSGAQSVRRIMRGFTYEKNHSGVKCDKSFSVDTEKILSHFVHLNGFSPVWVLSCFFKWWDDEKLLSQFVQFCAVICIGNVMKITQLEVRTVRWVKFELSNPNSGLEEFELFEVRYLPN